MNKVAILIPAYEPDDKLLTLVQQLRVSFNHVVVVDDGSVRPDASAVFEAVRALTDAVLVHETNRGKGAALRTGFAWIDDNLSDVEVVVTADSDGQHTPDDIRTVAKVALRHPQGLVLGVRRFAGRVPFRSILGNVWARVLFRLLTGVWIADTQTGLRAVPRKLFARMLSLSGDRYEYETRMLVDSRNHDAKPKQVPIETVYIDGNKSSHYRPFKDTVRTLWAMCAARFESSNK